MKTLDYIYYKIYRSLQKTAYADTAAFTAAVFFSGLITANLLILNDFLKNLNIAEIIWNPVIAIVFSIIMMILSLIYFVFNKRHVKIISKYSSETEKQRKRGNLMMWIYVITSFLIIFAEPLLCNPTVHLR